MKLSVFYDANRPCVRGLVQALKSHGYSILDLNPPLSLAALRALLRHARYLFLWNGMYKHCLPVVEAARQLGVQPVYMEVAWFPQKTYYYLDRKGVNCTSSLMDDDLGWVTTEHYDKLESHRAHYLQGRQWSGRNEYILCPLQLDGDTNVRCCSDYTSMQKFIDHCEERFPDRKLVFKRHPKDNRTYQTRHTLITEGWIIDWAQDAELVYGINSTSLLETTLLGTPTVACGNGLLKAHSGNERALMAALVDRQIPVGEVAVEPWLESAGIRL